jgi:hypothetical protein
VPNERFAHDRFLADQPIRPMINLYRVTPLAAGETPVGGPIAFVRQRRMAIKAHGDQGGHLLLRRRAGDAGALPDQGALDGRVIGHMNRKFQLRDRHVLDLSGNHERKLDRRLGIALAIGLDALQNR